VIRIERLRSDGDLTGTNAGARVPLATARTGTRPQGRACGANDQGSRSPHALPASSPRGLGPKELLFDPGAEQRRDLDGPSRDVRLLFKLAPSSWPSDQA